MRAVSDRVQDTVNLEIATRIRTHYPEGKKLKYQSPETWKPNAAFVNCYAGGAESVGYHSDQLTYLGPRAIIGSISLGVAREFRVRKIVARDDDNTSRADAEGQIAIHLPHNSLLVMHAEMQEEWKHSIAPALSIDPHPIAGNKRINITYRYYREPFHPKYVCELQGSIANLTQIYTEMSLQRSHCPSMCSAQEGEPRPILLDVSCRTHARERRVQKPCVLRALLIIYSCSFFQWAEFDEDGDPPWASKPRART